MTRGRALGAHLDEVLAAADLQAHVARDPVRFPRRYQDLADVEVAAVFAALLAFGRVELFGAVLERIFALADARGGPAAWVRGFGEADARALAPVYYRWFEGEDLAALARALQRVYAEHASLGELFPKGPVGEALEVALPRIGGGEGSRAYRTWFPRPSAGSACKRWLMLLRWMVRRDAVDLGVWAHLSPADLVIPVDTHVLRVAQFVGLTGRRAADWKTAVEITEGLRRFAPGDPVRYDFALAHLGISGACRGARDPEVCPRCPLDPVCRAS